MRRSRCQQGPRLRPAARPAARAGTESGLGSGSRGSGGVARSHGAARHPQAQDQVAGRHWTELAGKGAQQEGEARGGRQESGLGQRSAVTQWPPRSMT